MIAHLIRFIETFISDLKIGLVIKKEVIVIMDKFRLNLLICVIFIFAITTIAFLLTLFGKDVSSLSGSAVHAPGKDTPSVLSFYLPGLLFIGFLILSIVYLEKR